MTEQYPGDTRRSPVERFFGGHPLNVVLKLAFVSLLVGFAMSVFGVNVQSLVHGAISLLREALRDGTGLFRDLAFYIVTGATLVVPIWLLLRLGRRR